MAIYIQPQPKGRVFLCGKGQSHEVKVIKDNSDIDFDTDTFYLNLEVKVNADVDLPEIKTKRSLRPTFYVVEGYFGEWRATFDINDVLSGMFKERMNALEDNSSNRWFSFPADPDYPVKKPQAGSYIIVGYLYYSLFYKETVTGQMDESSYTGGTSDDLFRIMAGGLSRQMQAYLNSIGKDALQYFMDERKFLTWMPDEMHVHPRQPVRLWYYSRNIGELQLWAKIYYTDGTTTELTIGDPVNNDIVEVSAGPSELRLSTLYISKKILKYEVFLATTDTTHVTERRTFVIDYNYHERNDIFFFRNSLGFPEVFWANGQRSDKMNSDKKTHFFPLNKPGTKRGNVVADRGEFYREYKANTGFFPKKHRDYLSEFLNSAEVWYPAGYLIHPVIIEADSWDMGEDQEDVFSVDFTFREANTDNYHSAAPPVDSPFGDFNDDFNQDFLT